MSYTANRNTVNKSALQMIPQLFDSSLMDKYSDLSKSSEKEVRMIEQEIEDLRDVNSIYENGRFAAQLKIEQLKEKLNQLVRVLS